MEDQCCNPAALLPWKTWYPLYRRVGESQGQSGQLQKILPQPGLDPWTVQLVANRYSDWVIPAQKACKMLYNSVPKEMEKNRGSIPSREMTLISQQWKFLSPIYMFHVLWQWVEHGLQTLARQEHKYFYSNAFSCKHFCYKYSCTQDSQLYRITSNKCRINTVDPSDIELGDVRNIYRF